MDILTAIQSRASAVKLTEPGPTREHLIRILEAGVRAPDHGRLEPWRFVVMEGAAREKLAQAMIEVKRAKWPDANAVQLEAERTKALRAPTIIVVAARVVSGGKIPDIEQIIAVGAAVENMFLAANALGYGAMWKTGDVAYDARAKTMLGLEPTDHVVALLYLGTAVATAPQRPAKLDERIIWLS